MNLSNPYSPTAAPTAQSGADSWTASWPAGPWNHVVQPAAAPVASPWPTGLGYNLVYASEHNARLSEDLVAGSVLDADLVEDLYPDRCGDLVLPHLPAPQNQFQVSDSLLPDDAYTAYCPPLVHTRPLHDDYPLSLASPYAPSPSARVSALPPPPPPHNGVRVQFKGPNEVRQSTLSDQTTLQQHEQQVRALQHLEILGDEVIEVEVRTSRQDGEDGSERITFDSIEEALASIEEPEPQQHQPPHPNQKQPPVQVPVAASTRGMALADEKQEEVIKAAKSLFSKRTRTLYHWLYPDTSKTKLKATVSAAWDTLADTEKQFYLSQVLGRFGLQASSLMINPQLDGIKGLPVPVLGHSWSSMPSGVVGSSRTAVLPRPAVGEGLTEAQQAVNQLFASCADSDTWTSFTMSPSSPPREAVPNPLATTRTTSKTARSLCGFTERRKRGLAGEGEAAARLGALPSDQLDEEVNILKRMREAKLEAELDDDAELSSELEKFRLLANDNQSSSCRDGDDFWRRTPDPDDIFTQLDF